MIIIGRNIIILYIDYNSGKIGGKLIDITMIVKWHYDNEISKCGNITHVIYSCYIKYYKYITIINKRPIKGFYKRSNIFISNCRALCNS